jgi:hypothetical protein
LVRDRDHARLGLLKHEPVLDPVLCDLGAWRLTERRELGRIEAEQF